MSVREAGGGASGGPAAGWNTGRVSDRMSPADRVVERSTELPLFVVLPFQTLSTGRSHFRTSPCRNKLCDGTDGCHGLDMSVVLMVRRVRVSSRDGSMGLAST